MSAQQEIKKNLESIRRITEERVKLLADSQASVIRQSKEMKEIVNALKGER